jgi:hypothetical protein
MINQEKILNFGGAQGFQNRKSMGDFVMRWNPKCLRHTKSQNRESMGAASNQSQNREREHGSRNPIPEFASEAQMLKQLHQIIPSNRVKGIFYVKFEEKRWRFGLVHLPCQVPYIQEIIMDASFLNECALGIGDELVHVGSKSKGHHLGD